MPEYVSAGMLEQVRFLFRAALDHTYTRLPTLATAPPDEDAWGQSTVMTGPPVAGLPCKLTFSEAVQRDERGATTTKRPLLWIAHDDPLAIGDQVREIRDGDGRLLLGAAAVTRHEASPDRRGAATLVVELLVTESNVDAPGVA